MGVIANLSVSVSADTSHFTKGMKTAEQTLEQFDAKARAAQSGSSALSGELGRLTESSRGGRIAVTQVAQALTGMGSAFGQVAQAGILLGPVVGGIIGAFEVYNHITAANTKLSEEAANSLEHRTKMLEKFRDAQEKANEIMNKMPSGGEFSKGTEAEIKSLNSDLKELYKERDEAQKKGMGSAELNKYDQERDKIVALRNSLTEFWTTQQDANKAKREFEQESYDAKISTHGMSEDAKLSKELDVTQEYANKLSDTLKSGVLGNGEAYNEVLKESHNQQLKILDILDKQAANNEKLAKAEDEKNKKADEAIEKQFKASIEAEKKVNDEAEKLKAIDPAEKFRQDMEKVVELFAEGKISEKVINLHLKAAEDEYVRNTKKDGEFAGGGSFRQIDTSRINTQALALTNKKQEINSAQLEQTNAILEKINEKFGISTTQGRVVGE